jgi:hypothetical protein
MAEQPCFAVSMGSLRFFAKPLVLILLATSHLIVLGDQVVGSIISAIVLLRVIVNFYVGFGVECGGGHRRRAALASCLASLPCPLCWAPFRCRP